MRRRDDARAREALRGRGEVDRLDASRRDGLLLHGRRRARASPGPRPHGMELPRALPHHAREVSGEADALLRSRRFAFDVRILRARPAVRQAPLRLHRPDGRDVLRPRCGGLERHSRRRPRQGAHGQVSLRTVHLVRNRLPRRAVRQLGEEPQFAFRNLRPDGASQGPLLPLPLGLERQRRDDTHCSALDMARTRGEKRPCVLLFVRRPRGAVRERKVDGRSREGEAPGRGIFRRHGRLSLPLA